MTATLPTTCPNAEQLRKLIRGKLADSQQAEITAHLDDCLDCQRTLELMAEGDANISGTVRHIDKHTPSSDSALWMAINPSSVNVTSTFSTPEPRPNDSKLDFLRPSEEPGKLGRIGDFEVTREIGRGGMGIVLAATDTHLDREVAIKVLDPQLANNDTARARFCREARAAAAVTHENIVTVYSVNEDDVSGLPYLTMQIVNGETLEQRIRREEKLKVDDLVTIAYQAAQGLAAAHAAGLIHRDIKPGNILLEAGTNKARLTDFGLARGVEDMSLTRTGFVAGTPLYMAPEQARGDDVDSRADLFSLGSVMYEALAGRPPFGGTTPLAVLRRVADEAHPRLSRLNTDVPDWLEDVIDELLEKDPKHRIASAEVLVQRLAMHLSSDACPTATPVECTVKSATRFFGLRRRSPLVTAAVLAIPFLVGALTGAVIAFRVIPPEEKIVTVENTVPVQTFVPTAAVATGPESLRTISAESGVWSVAATDGKVIVAGFEDGSFGMWNLEPYSRVLSVPGAHEAPIWSVDISQDGKTIITASDDGTVKVWEATKGTLVQTLKHPTSVRSAALDHTGTKIATGDRAGMVRVWNIGNEKAVQEFKHGGTINAVAFDPLGMCVVSTSTNGTAKLWDIPFGKERVNFTKHKGPVYGVAFSPEGEWVATASWDKRVLIWDPRSGEVVKEIQADDEGVLSVAFSCCGKILATAGQDGTVKVWDAEKGTELDRFTRHKGTVHAVKFIPKAHMLVSGGRDGTIRIWPTR